ncbi:MAG: type II toxin-antitoxin system VapC family toxin [Treponema sp.]|nr:type II toxin-antitoxin system VapC family toxin [Treponema sp.]
MTHLLLDTNAFLWYFWGSARIDTVRHLIESKDTDVFISAATWWEIAIKVRTGKLAVDIEQLRSYAEEHSFVELPVTGAYMKAYLELPALHKDSFDHMLLAQAISSPMRLITGDSFLAEYSSLVTVV